MIKQSEIFLDGEGDAWHRRNLGPRMPDRLTGILIELKFKPKAVLEFGCGTGRRLEGIRRQFGSWCVGIDPSREAIMLGELDYPELNLGIGTIMNCEFGKSYDLIIFGFCLYLLDREDLFSMIERTDRFLVEGGYLAIHDFDPESPQVVPYHHKPGVYSYKMDHAKLWLANPAYELICKVRITHEESITILRKNSWEQFK